MPNMNSYISKHNNKILQQNLQPHFAFTTKFATTFKTKFATTTKSKFNKQGTGEEGSPILQLHQQSQLPYARKMQK